MSGRRIGARQPRVRAGFTLVEAADRRHDYGGRPEPGGRAALAGRRGVPGAARGHRHSAAAAHRRDVDRRRHRRGRRRPDARLGRDRRRRRGPPCCRAGGPACRWPSMPGGCARDDAITRAERGRRGSPGHRRRRRRTRRRPCEFAPLSACALVRPACRLEPGARALIIDGTGRWDVVAVTSVSPDGTEIGHDAGRPVAGGRAGRAGRRGLRARIPPEARPGDRRHAIEARNRRRVGRPGGRPGDRALVRLLRPRRRRPVVIAGAPPDAASTTYGPLPPPLGRRRPCPTRGLPARTASSASKAITRCRGSRRSQPTTAGWPSCRSSSLADGPWCPDERRRTAGMPTCSAFGSCGCRSACSRCRRPSARRRGAGPVRQPAPRWCRIWRCASMSALRNQFR